MPGCIARPAKYVDKPELCASRKCRLAQDARHKAGNADLRGMRGIKSNQFGCLELCSEGGLCMNREEEKE